MNLLKYILIALLIIIVQNSTGYSDDWSNQELSSYIGDWAGSGFNRKFPYAHYVQLAFWINNQEDLEGAAIFIKDDQYCIGQVRMDSLKDSLVFFSKEGDLCQDLSNSTISLKRSLKYGVFSLRFHTPTPVEDLYNVSNFRKMEEPNKKLQPYIEIFRDNTQDLESIQRSQTKEHAKAIAEINEAMQQPYSLDFRYSKMIGVWEGKFVDKKTVYPAKILFWSGNPHRYQVIVGLTVFDELPLSAPLCPATVNQGRESENIAFVKIGGVSINQSCMIIGSNGRTYWNSENDTLMFVLQSHFPSSLNNTGNCCLGKIQGTVDLSEEIVTPCVIGLFSRTEADEDFRQSIDDIEWGGLLAPTPEEQLILFEQPDQIDKLIAAHETAALKNVIVDQQLQKEREEAEKSIEAERAARYAAAKKAEAEQRKTTVSQNRSYQNEDGEKLVSVPAINGPFDGLHGASFLNALYKGDWSSIEQFNSAYQNQKLQQIKKFWGDEPHWTDGFINAAYKSIDLTSTVIAIYLFNYDTEYGACLDSDAVTFEVVEEVPDTVTYNLLV